MIKERKPRQSRFVGHVMRRRKEEEEVAAVEKEDLEEKKRKKKKWVGEGGRRYKLICGL